VSVVRVLGRNRAQEVLHIFNQERFVLVYFDRRSRVARKDDRNSRFNFRLPNDIDNEIRDVYEFRGSSRLHVEALRERPQYVSSPSWWDLRIFRDRDRSVILSKEICTSNLADSPNAVSVISKMRLGASCICAASEDFTVGQHRRECSDRVTRTAHRPQIVPHFPGMSGSVFEDRSKSPSGWRVRKS